jgi:hypothetical protein
MEPQTIIEKRSTNPHAKIAQLRPIYTQEIEDAAVDALRNGTYLRNESVVKFEGVRELHINETRYTFSEDPNAFQKQFRIIFRKDNRG